MKTPATLGETLQHFMRLIRWPNLLMIALSQVMTRIFLIGPAHTWPTLLRDLHLWGIVGATVLIAAAGYIINDYFDVKIDLINKPDRVVVGRHLRRRWVMGAHQALSFLGCALALWVSKWVFLVSALTVGILWLYAATLKRKPFIGNVIVALLTALSLLLVSLYYPQNHSVVYLYGLFVFTISLIREVIKDMEDLRGDSSVGCRTLPIVWGVRNTKILLYGLTALFIMLLYGVAYYLQNVTLGWIFTAMMLPVGIFTYRLVYADTKRAFGFLSNLCKMIMLMGMVSMIWI